MTTLELRSNIHRLIDTIQDESVLSGFYAILIKTKERKNGVLWQNLTKEEQDELLQIERESREESNLVSNSEMIKKHKKWL